MTTKCQSSGSHNSDEHNNALIEIIHLHNCFRGAIKDLQTDVRELQRLYDEEFGDDVKVEAEVNVNRDHRTKDLLKVNQMEGSIAGRFKVIWSVFSAHSNAEGELFDRDLISHWMYIFMYFNIYIYIYIYK